MLTEPNHKNLQDLIASCSREELIWINGYLSGLIEKNAGSGAASSNGSHQKGAGKITITYGTETGNSKKVALDFANRAKTSGIQAKLINLEQYRLNDLPKEEYFFTVISTQGDGEPPASAQKFYDYIQKEEVTLDKLKFGVLALGDTSYPLFCKAGEIVDERLSSLGGKRLISLQRCDTDYDEEASAWFSEVISTLKNESAGTAVALPAVKKSSGKKIYEGTILTNIDLNDRGSAKKTHHIEIAVDDLDYLPGDSLGLIPENGMATVENILELSGIDRSRPVNRQKDTLAAEEFLKKKLNIIYLSERVIRQYAEITGHDIPVTRMGLTDLLKIYPVKDAAQFEEVIKILEPITPRLYSIASSPQAHQGEVHLTVALEIFKTNDEIRLGHCSDFLISQPENAALHFYIHKNQVFKLPEPDQDVIMIGPGTGIAPFRSFLAEREAIGAEGRNWLFFGDQHFTTDFLYQTEIQNWYQTGLLTRVNLAFSRDQPQKIYVQHRMKEQGAELFDWLSKGAYLYICGSLDPMSADVERTLLEIFAEYGENKHPESWLEELRESGRYLRDVY